VPRTRRKKKRKTKERRRWRPEDDVERGTGSRTNIRITARKTKAAPIAGYGEPQTGVVATTRRPRKRKRRIRDEKEEKTEDDGWRRRRRRRRRRRIGRTRRCKKREMEVGGYSGARAGEERRRREEEEDDGVLSRRDLAEEVQTGLYLHNRYIPAAWTGMEAESSVSSVRYIARLVLARRQSPEISRGIGEREEARERKRTRFCFSRKRRKRRRTRTRRRRRCAFDCGAHKWRSARGVRRNSREERKA